MKMHFISLLKCKTAYFQSIKISLIGIASLFAVMESGAQDRPNIIYILTDQWASSAFGYAGNTQVKTPNIDALSRESVIFRNCVSVLPICTPYRAALMTGRYPTTTGMFTNDLYLPERELCMAEIFKKAGYSTAYYGKWHLDGHGRMNNVQPYRRQGFDYWKASECSHDYNKMIYYENDDFTAKYWEKYSPFAIEEDAEKYLEKASKEKNPFLLFLSLETPHFSKHQAPEEYQEMYKPSELQLRKNVIEDKLPDIREELHYYYAHCTATDKAIGDLINKIKALGLFDNSVIIFTTDHGEMMGSHGVRPRDKQIFWDEAVKVPFLIRYPGIGMNAGKETFTPLTTPDILPTILALAHINIPHTIEGKDISSVVKNPGKEKDRAVIFMNVYPTALTSFPEYRAIKTNRYTYIKTTEKAIMLFDNISDPYEMNNLLDKPEFSKLQNKMEKQLQKELKAIGDQDFKESRYYLDKFGFHDIAEKKGAVLYSIDPCQLTRVYTPKTN